MYVSFRIVSSHSNFVGYLLRSMSSVSQVTIAWCYSKDFFNFLVVYMNLCSDIWMGLFRQGIYSFFFYLSITVGSGACGGGGAIGPWPSPQESKFYIRYKTESEKSPRTTLDWPKNKGWPPLVRFLNTPLLPWCHSYFSFFFNLRY